MAEVSPVEGFPEVTVMHVLLAELCVQELNQVRMVLQQLPNLQKMLLYAKAPQQ